MEERPSFQTIIEKLSKAMGEELEEEENSTPINLLSRNLSEVSSTSLSGTSGSEDSGSNLLSLLSTSPSTDVSSDMCIKAVPVNFTVSKIVSFADKIWV